jgi:hypothetical protein
LISDSVRFEAEPDWSTVEEEDPVAAEGDSGWDVWVFDFDDDFFFFFLGEEEPFNLRDPPVDSMVCGKLRVIQNVRLECV